MNNNLINESLDEQSSFSSNVHVLETFTAEKSDNIKEYYIPQRYYQNKLTLLPINKTRIYFYWEFTQEFLHQNIVKREDISFHIIDQNHELIDKIDCSYEFGEYFYTLQNPNIQSIKVIAIYKHGIQYKNLLESNSVLIPKDKINYPTNEVYMKKLEGVREVINASLNHVTLGMSSKEYARKSSKVLEYSTSENEHHNSKILGER